MVVLGGWVFLMSEVPLYAGRGDEGVFLMSEVPLYDRTLSRTLSKSRAPLCVVRTRPRLGTLQTTFITGRATGVPRS